ncbi:MAG: suppressor of fused domain protein [Planctomycetota bacterium]
MNDEPIDPNSDEPTPRKQPLEDILPPEKNPDGSTVYRHEPRQRDFELAVGDHMLIEAVEKHLTDYLGESNGVFHEIVSDLVHLDLHMFPPNDERPFWYVVTTGMAERPMQTPEGVENMEFAELAVALPADWPMDKFGAGVDVPEDEQEAAYWPLKWLKFMARLPHEYETWLGAGHTVPNGDPPEPLHESTALIGSVCLPPLFVGGDGFGTVQVGDRTVHLYQLLLLHADEMQYKLDHGLDALLDRLEEAKVLPIVDPQRPSCVAGSSKPAKPWWKLW